MKLHIVGLAGLLALTSCLSRKFNGAEIKDEDIYPDPWPTMCSDDCPDVKRKLTTKPYEWKSQKILTPNKITYVFHHSKSASACSNTSSYMLAAIRAARNNGTATTIHPEAVAGDGLYVAADPFSSAAYGPFLLSVAVKPNIDLVYRTTGDIFAPLTLEMIKAPARGLLYIYSRNIVKKDALQIYSAMVIRDETIVEFSKTTCFAAKSVTSGDITGSMSWDYRPGGWQKNFPLTQDAFEVLRDTILPTQNVETEAVNLRHEIQRVVNDAFDVKIDLLFPNWKTFKVEDYKHCRGSRKLCIQGWYQFGLPWNYVLTKPKPDVLALSVRFARDLGVPDTFVDASSAERFTHKLFLYMESKVVASPKVGPSAKFTFLKKFASELENEGMNLWKEAL